VDAFIVSIGIIFFPGIIACVICDKLTVHTVPWDSFKYTLYSFVMGVCCYLFIQMIYCVDWLVATWRYCPLLDHEGFKVLTAWSIASDTEKPTNSLRLTEVAFATLVSPLVAAFFAVSVNKKWLNKFATRLNISDKYGDENLFSYFLNSKEVSWIYIRDIENGLTYQGLVIAFSEKNSLQELLLRYVTVYRYEDSVELYSVPLILLAKPAGSFIIETIPPKLLEAENAERET